jgi:hypothetical protein
MFLLNKPARLLSASFALLALTACGGEPSESDIKTAFNNQVQAETKAMQQFAGKAGADMAKSLMPEIKSVKKIGCKEDGEKAYKCDVEMEVTQSGTTNKGIVPMRFVKGSDGWMAARS